jgi:hypothetical protein
MKTNEQIIKAYEKYIALFAKYFSDANATELDSLLGPRLAVAARGLTLAEGGYAGGLVDFAISAAKKSKIFTDVTDTKSLVRVALVNELGKIGDDKEDFLIPQESSWHVEKLGQYYKFNPACEKMLSSHRTLYFVSKLGINLNSDEWIAIITSSGLHVEDNGFYARNSHLLTHVWQTCKCLAENELKATIASSNE